MTTFKITYKMTGRVNDTDSVSINTGDIRNNGSAVRNIADAIEYFEELAAGWGTYENKNAITKIETI